MDELSSYDPFATAEDFATITRRSLSGPDTATVETLLAAASEEIRDHCGWQIWPQVADDALTVDGSGGSELVLPVSYVVDVSLVTELGTDLDAEDYDWGTAGILSRRGCWWTNRRRGVVAVVTHGYGTSPWTLVQLSVALAQRAFDSPRGELSVAAGAVNVTYSRTAAGQAGGIVLTAADDRRLLRFLANTGPRL